MMNADREGGDRPRILLVDDHGLFATALQLALQRQEMKVEVVSEDLRPEAVLAAAERFGPDVALVDLHLGPGKTAVPVIRLLVVRGVTVLVLTGSQDPCDLAECLDAGAVAVLSKSDSLAISVDAVRRVLAGEAVRISAREEILAAGRRARAARGALMEPFDRLTAREREVLAAMIAGRSAEQIAADCYLSLATVRSHIRSILAKLQVSSQLAAVALARQANWSRRD